MPFAITSPGGIDDCAASASPTIAPAETAAKTTALNVLLDFVLPFARQSSETATHVCVIVFQITL